MSDTNPDAAADGLSDDALKVVLGFFSFGAKATLNSHPPHANMTANKAALDELLAAGIITHSYEARRDIHSYQGSSRCDDIRATPRVKALLTAILG